MKEGDQGSVEKWGGRIRNTGIIILLIGLITNPVIALGGGVFGVGGEVARRAGKKQKKS